jgi:hypothetical protein
MIVSAGLRHPGLVLPSSFAFANPSACNCAKAGHNWLEMSGFLFGFPSLRFLRRFRVFEITVRPFAPGLLRWLTAKARGFRQAQSRLDEAEFPTASQSALLEWTLDDWRAADGVLNCFGTLRPNKKWTKRKDQHELLSNWETLASFARRFPTPWQRPCASSATRSEGAKKNILATGCRIFRQWLNEGETKRTRRCPAFAIST